MGVREVAVLCRRQEVQRPELVEGYPREGLEAVRKHDDQSRRVRQEEVRRTCGGRRRGDPARPPRELIDRRRRADEAPRGL